MYTHPISVCLAPETDGKLLYLCGSEMAKNSSTDALVSIRAEIKNRETFAITLNCIKVSFPGSTTIKPVVFTKNLVIESAHKKWVYPAPHECIYLNEQRVPEVITVDLFFAHISEPVRLQRGLKAHAPAFISTGDRFEGDEGNTCANERWAQVYRVKSTFCR